MQTNHNDGWNNSSSARPPDAIHRNRSPTSTDPIYFDRLGSVLAQPHS